MSTARAGAHLVTTAEQMLPNHVHVAFHAAYVGKKKVGHEPA